MVIKKGGKVAEKDLAKVIELLMNELIKLDGIVAEGDVKLQRKMQVRDHKDRRLVLGLGLVVTVCFIFICVGEESAELYGST